MPAAPAHAPDPNLLDPGAVVGAASPPRITLAGAMALVAGVAAVMASARMLGWPGGGTTEFVLFVALPVPGFALFLALVAVPYALDLRPTPTEQTLRRSRLHRGLREGVFWFATVYVSGVLFVIAYLILLCGLWFAITVIARAG